jgi:4-amino-4-deoxy-L-arabinose transferase-like glycosyltransferase
VYDPKVGLFSGLILSFDHLFIRNTLLAMLDTPCIFFILLSILFFHEYINYSRAYFLLFSGASLGLSVASKYFGFLTVPIILIWLMSKRVKNALCHKRRRKLVFALAAWILMGVSVFIFVNLGCGMIR